MQQNISFDAAFGTRFSVSVDTEEEFDWAGQLTRDGHGVASAAALGSGQTYFKSAGVVPVYYMDYPVAECDAALDALGPSIAEGAAEIGVHLHPWVTPPFTETVSRHNSYAGNLDAVTERAKLSAIRERIIARYGVVPIAYRAGRYGIGPNSHDILIEQGFKIDSSIRALFDYRDDGGPDFRGCNTHAHWADTGKRLIELPLTAHYLGWGGQLKPHLFNVIRDSATLRAIAARTGLVERVPLTPEGTPPARACAMIDHALDHGVRLLSMSFHSPSLAPGYTPYVRDTADLATFYRWFDTVFDHCARRGILSASLTQIVAAAEKST
jgi:hypothetical protein